MCVTICDAVARSSEINLCSKTLVYATNYSFELPKHLSDVLSVNEYNSRIKYLIFFIECRVTFG